MSCACNDNSLCASARKAQIVQISWQARICSGSRLNCMRLAAHYGPLQGGTACPYGLQAWLCRHCNQLFERPLCWAHKCHCGKRTTLLHVYDMHVHCHRAWHAEVGRHHRQATSATLLGTSWVMQAARTVRVNCANCKPPSALQDCHAVCLQLTSGYSSDTHDEHLPSRLATMQNHNSTASALLALVLASLFIRQAVWGLAHEQQYTPHHLTANLPICAGLQAHPLRSCQQAPRMLWTSIRPLHPLVWPSTRRPCRYPSAPCMQLHISATWVANGLWLLSMQSHQLQQAACSLPSPAARSQSGS